MDNLVIQLGIGLGLQNAIGWFPPVYYGIVNVLPMLLTLFFYADKSTEFNKNTVIKRSDGIDPEIRYDFIIVGGGSAGSVVANRLSAHFNVLLLEQGGEPNPFTTVPGLQGALLGRPETDHRYFTVPQNSSCLAMENRQCLWNAGLGLGGTSIVNGMVYIRGHPFDYDQWANITRDDRWSYKNVLPYFLQSEGYCDSCDPSEGIKPIINPRYHNSKGELTVRPPPETPLVSEFLEASEWSGVSRGDLNAPFYAPIADTVSLTINRGRRRSAYHAFVAPLIGRRKTLTVMKYARVIQVLFSDTNEAIGVKFERFGRIEFAYANKEIILSAGTIGSPKILMLSGIGDRDALEKLSIPVRCNLAEVGKNLQDHAGAFVGPFLIDVPKSTLEERDLDDNEVEKFFNGTGLFTIPYLRATSYWVSQLALSSGEKDWPDLQVSMSSNGISRSIIDGNARMYNVRRDVLQEFFEPIIGKDAFSLSISFVRPRSRGVITLKSSNYLDEPLINPAYFEDADGTDIQVLVEAIQRAVNFVESAPVYQKIGARLSPIPFPPCKNIPFKSNSYWECFARHFTLTRRHYVGTAGMGAKGSKSVVDSELKVNGVRSLRIIDNSVIPTVTSGNTNAPAILLGELGATFLLSDHLKQQPSRVENNDNYDDGVIRFKF